MRGWMDGKLCSSIERIATWVGGWVGGWEDGPFEGEGRHQMNKSKQSCVLFCHIPVFAADSGEEAKAFVLVFRVGKNHLEWVGGWLRR